VPIGLAKNNPGFSAYNRWTNFGPAVVNYYGAVGSLERPHFFRIKAQISGNCDPAVLGIDA
jgi:hypothetical protein